MSDVEVFQFPATGQEVRAVVDDGPWWVAADVCAVLAHSNPTMAVAGLDEDERGLRIVETPSGQQQMVVINEAGLYSLILRSRKPEAKAFKRWVTHEVLPAVRQTGRYESAPALPRTYADALRELAATVEEAERTKSELAIAAPKAQSWDTLASGDGDYAVADAAKILSRDPVIALGERRLFAVLSDQGWIYRQRADNRWRVYQVAVERGWLSEMPASHYHPQTGELVLDPPQVRVKPKGLAELHRRLGGLQPLRLYEQTELPVT